MAQPRISNPRVDIATIENRLCNSVKPPKNIKDNTTNRVALKGVSGWHSLNRCTKPINPVAITHIEETSLEGSVNTKFPSMLMVVTVRTISKAVGIAFLRMYFKNEPSTRLWLGSRASTNDGIPIHIPLIKVSCIGTKGYSNDRNINTKSSSME
jgi:hypothetical protein